MIRQLDASFFQRICGRAGHYYGSKLPNSNLGNSYNDFQLPLPPSLSRKNISNFYRYIYIPNVHREPDKFGMWPAEFSIMQNLAEARSILILYIRSFFYACMCTPPDQKCSFFQQRGLNARQEYQRFRPSRNG